MLKSKKNVFWEALIVTIAIFLIGLYIGILIETSNKNQISSIYLRSEISLVDGLASSLLTEQNTSNCSVIKENNINFADRVYEEAKLLERYEESGKLTDSLKFLHKKYDLLRTLLWMSNQDSLSRCKNYNLVVYLYEYGTEEIEKKARQNVWSKILRDIREERDDILLLPIAADQNLSSLNFLLVEHNITNLPAIVVNNKKVVYSIENKNSLYDFFLT